MGASLAPLRNKDPSVLLQERMPFEDMLARLGSDEFAVPLEEASVDRGKRVAERMRQALGERHSSQIALTGWGTVQRSV